MVHRSAFEKREKRKPTWTVEGRPGGLERGPRFGALRPYLRRSLRTRVRSGVRRAAENWRAPTRVLMVMFQSHSDGREAAGRLISGAGNGHWPVTHNGGSGAGAAVAGDAAKAKAP